MKKLILAGLLLSVLAISIGCKKDEEKQPESGISFKVDGAAWQSTTVIAQRVSGMTQIAATNDDGTINMLFDGTTGTFGPQDVMMYYQAGMTMYSADEELDPTATLNITKYDEANHKIDGTFSFKGYTSEGNFVTITEGKITNVTYIQQ